VSGERFGDAAARYFRCSRARSRILVVPVSQFLWPGAVELAIFAEFKHVIAGHAQPSLAAFQRFAFYKRTRQALALVATGGRWFDHNLLPKNGVVPRDGVAR
jgi:hypothetical protein